MAQHPETLLIVDFGSQYNLLIARRIRELGVFCEIVSPRLKQSILDEKNVQGVILSGGPASIYDKRAPKLQEFLLSAEVPVLGICYGMQALCQHAGGRVKQSTKREYGRAVLDHNGTSTLFKDVPRREEVWMSHSDRVVQLPKDFLITAQTRNSDVAAFENPRQRLYGLQFHPEVVHTKHGVQILKNFAYDICSFKGNWTAGSFIDSAIEEIRQTVGKDEVILGLSGGVDSSVVAALLSKAIGKKLTCIFVDNGLLRKYERQQVERFIKKQFKLNLRTVSAEKRFLKGLKGVLDPERKRKIIGREFVNVFLREAKRCRRAKYLAQGTLYPDVVESQSAFGGPSAKIKTHHNVGGLPRKLKLKLIEPLRELFKDEVREVGKTLGIADELVQRHPFPGPGLAVRVVGEVTKERCDILREVDYIFIEELKRSKLYASVWQAFSVFLPVKSVGVMGDQRTYENVVALRAITSVDGMTADWAHLPYDFLARVSNLIINEVKGVNRVVYDISSKPPATIEWE